MRGLVYIKPSPEGGDDKRGGADFRSTAKKQQCRNKGADVSFISEVVLGIRRRDRRLRFCPQACCSWSDAKGSGLQRVSRVFDLKGGGSFSMWRCSRRGRSLRRAGKL